MKALSIRQPWAELIAQGKKTLELRSWKVAYRGKLAIHASQTIDEHACQQHGIPVDRLSSGAVIGVVELVDILQLDEVTYQAMQGDHLSLEPYKPPLYGWKIIHPQPLPDPFPFTGRKGIFNVPDNLVTSIDNEPERKDLPGIKDSYNARLPFELRVVIEPRSSPALATYRLALFQNTIVVFSDQLEFPHLLKPQQRLISELGGTPLKAVADVVLEALRSNGYSATDLGARRQEPFHLSEESGVRLALIFMAVRPVLKIGRIEEISRSIRSMTGEELYYWFAKCTSSHTAARAQKALRILVADE